MESAPSGPDVFISYRHADTREIVDRIYDYLREELGETRVFRDVEGIGKAELIRDRVDAALKSCKVMLVVIGKNWTDAGDREKGLRLFDPDDYVRHEITTALKIGARIIIVTVHNADFPSKAMMPPEIHAALDRLACPVRGNPYFKDDKKFLASAIKEALLDLAAPERSRGKPVAVRFVGHSNIFFWWPVWMMGFILSVLTWWQDQRLAVVPAQAVIEHNKNDQRLLLAVPEGKTNVALKQAEDQQLKGDPAFPHRIDASGNFGVLFITVLILTILITNVRLQGIWSLVVIGSLIAVSLLLALLNAWDGLLEALAQLKIHITGSGYVYVSTSLFLFWLMAVLVFDRQAYVIFTPREVRIRSELGGPEMTFSVFNLSVTKRREDDFRHQILGQGSGDLIIRTAGEDAQEIIFFNVLFIGHKLKLLREMYSESPVKIME